MRKTKTRFFMSLLLAVFGLCSASSLSAQDGSTTWVEGEHYVLSEDGKTLTNWKADYVELLDMNADPKLSQVERIGDSSIVFKTIGTFIVGDKVVKIDPMAFISSSFEKVQFGKATAELDGAFLKASGLKDFEVPFGNTTLVKDGGALYTADHSKLIIYIAPEGQKKFSVNDATKTIARGCFFMSPALETIVFPEGLEKVDRQAFYHVFSLRKVIFGSQLKEVGKEIFDACTKLFQIDIAAVEVPNTGDNIFKDLEPETLQNIELRVPAESVSKYRDHAEWGKVGRISELQTIPSDAYTISEDGKTLIEWLTPMQNIDMASDPLLNEVEIIGEDAFAGFEVSGRLETLTLPVGLKRIENGGFMGCANLVYMPLPETLEYIGDEALALAMSYCEDREIILPSALKHIGKEAFYAIPAKRLTIPAATEEIGEYAFAGMRKLVSITVEEENTHYASRYGILLSKDLKVLILCPINKYTTEYDLAREGFTGLEEIAPHAFEQQEWLKSIIFPETLKKIGDAAFRNITTLVHVELPASLEQLGEQVFYRTIQLESITISPDNQHFVVEDNVLYNKDKTIALQGCAEHKYRNYSLPESVKKIANGAFAEMQWLYSLRLQDGLEEIGENAFFLCAQLNAVDIPSTTKKIGEMAFARNRKLSKVIVRAGDVPQTGDDAFEDIAQDEATESELYVPDDSMYKYANETAYKKFDNILPISKLSANLLERVGDYRLSICETGVEISELPAGSIVGLYTLDGALQYQVKADAEGRAYLPALPGNYLVSIDGQVRKIVVE